MSERIIPRLQAALHNCHWSRDKQGILRGDPTVRASRPAKERLRDAASPHLASFLAPGEVSRTGAASGDNLISSDNAATVSPAIPPSPQRGERFRQLLHYLDSGRVADVGSWSNRQARDAWLMDALPHSAPSAREALALRVLQPSGWQRLVSTWSPPILVKVLLWLASSPLLPPPPEVDVARYAPLAALLALQQHPETWQDAGVMQALVALSDLIWPGHPSVLLSGDKPVAQSSAFSAPSNNPWHHWLSALAATPLPLSARVWPEQDTR